jgi:hypothetical protein
MEYRLSIQTMTLGSLAFCFLMLALGWALDLVKNRAKRVSTQAGRYVNYPSHEKGE